MTRPRLALLVILCLVIPCKGYGQLVTPPEDQLQAIQSAYQNVDFATAEGLIEQALETYQLFLPAQLATVHLYAALIGFAQNETIEARQHLRTALQLQPELRLDPIEIPPGLIAMADEIKEELQVSVQEDAAETRYIVLQDPRPQAALRSMLLPGWGQFYKGEQKKGLIFISAWGATVLGSGVAHLMRENRETAYLNAPRDEIQERYRSFDTWHVVRNNLILAAAGVWVSSYVDALVSRNPDAASLSFLRQQPFIEVRPTGIRQPGFQVSVHF